jgi:cytochrome P450
MMTLPPFDPLTPGFSEDPYPFYRQYREAAAVQSGRPIQPGRPDAYWHVFGYAEAIQALKDPRLLRGPLMSNKSGLPPGSFSILMMDPPDHTRLRQLVSRTFTPRAIARVLPLVDQLTEEVLRDTEDQPTWDLVAGFAYPLPVTVISALLGIPLADRAAVRRWSHAITAALDVVTDAETFWAAQAALVALGAYLRDMIRERQHHPQDDLVTQLLTVEEAGDRLQADELTALLALLVVAGHETTVNLITNGLWALWQDPESLGHVRSEGLTARGVEELLRFDAPVQATARVAAADVTLGGRTVPGGSVVVIWLGAANRDPAVFTDPDRLRLDRDPNHHVAFGGGIHSCLGAALAAAEGRAALSALLRRYPHLELVTSTAARRPGLVFRGLETVMIAV